VFADHRAIAEACCEAWHRLVADPGRLRSLCDQPWIKDISSQTRQYNTGPGKF